MLKMVHFPDAEPGGSWPLPACPSAGPGWMERYVGSINPVEPRGPDPPRSDAPSTWELPPWPCASELVCNGAHNCKDAGTAAEVRATTAGPLPGWGGPADERWGNRSADSQGITSPVKAEARRRKRTG